MVLCAAWTSALRRGRGLPRRPPHHPQLAAAARVPAAAEVQPVLLLVTWYHTTGGTTSCGLYPYVVGQTSPLKPTKMDAVAKIMGLFFKKKTILFVGIACFPSFFEQKIVSC